MEDIEFVKKLLESDYRFHLPKEYPYPELILTFQREPSPGRGTTVPTIVMRLAISTFQIAISGYWYIAS